MVSADGVDGVIIREANKSRLVVYEQTEQEFIAAEKQNSISNNTHTHTRLTALCPGLPG